MYKTELHVHSSSVSNCSDVPEDSIARRYIAAGYTTIVLTNHLSKFTYKNKRFDRSGDTWDTKIDYYMNGIKKLTEAAVGRINVLWGVELRSNINDNDYLIYGVDERFLRSTPDIMDMKIKLVAEAVHEVGGLFCQAHPFRNDMKVTKPELLDGIEVFNGHSNHDSRNDIAEAWAEKFGLLGISGSDLHHPYQAPCGGIVTDGPVTDIGQLVSLLREKRYGIIRGEAAGINEHTAPLC